jgi:hypothetical protein
MISEEHKTKGDILIEDIQTVKTILKSRVKREFHACPDFTSEPGSVRTWG